VRTVRGLLIALVLTAVPGLGRAAEAPPTRADVAGVPAAAAEPVAGAGVDSARAMTPAPAQPWLRRPRQIMLRSAVVPGWGQWANGRHVKAVLFAAGEGYLLWRAVDWGRQEQAKWRQVLAETDPAERARLERRHRTLGAHRRDFTWWSVFAGLLSVGDAYVDAQLGNFDAEFKPQDTTGPGGDDPGWRAAVTLRW
jgi:hypothetical protein